MRWHRTQIPLGAVDVSTVLQYASKLPQYAATIAEVIDDPYLPETACRVDQIYQARHGLPVRDCSSTTASGNPSAGVGLRRAMPLLRFAAYAERNKWAYVAALAAVIGLPLALGYSIGHRHGKGSR